MRSSGRLKRCSDEVVSVSPGQPTVSRIHWKARQNLQVNACSWECLKKSDIPRKLAHLAMQGSPDILCCQEGKSVLFLSMYHSKADYFTQLH